MPTGAAVSDAAVESKSLTDAEIPGPRARPEPVLEWRPARFPGWFTYEYPFGGLTRGVDRSRLLLPGFSGPVTAAVEFR